MPKLATGYIPRDYEAHPEFSAFPEYSGPRFPISQWDELIELHEANRSSPFHIHQDNKTKLISQGSWGYCWMYGVVQAMQIAYQAQGLNPWPELNPFGTAYLGKKGANRGGYGIEACRYIEKFGVAEFSHWRDKKGQRMTPELKAHMAKHKIVQFEEFGRGDFEGMVSAILDPENSCATSAAYNHMRHLMAAVWITKGSHNVICLNSWGSHRNTDRVPKGFYELRGRNRTAFEVVGIRSVLPRREG